MSKRNQTGARYLQRLKNRQDETYNGIIKLVNHKPMKSTKLATGARKRVKVCAQ